jgi:uncharacterized protein YcbK (DUF882 family)
MRHASFALAGILATLPVTRATVADLPIESSSGLATRKDRACEEMFLEQAPELGDPEQARAERGSVEPDVAAEPLETWATLFNTHTGESIPLSSSEPSLARFCDTLADRATASRAELDPRLLELLRQIALRHPGARIELVSGYRSAKLNEMMRKKGHHVASHSQHSLGHAVDFRVVGLSPRELKQELLQIGWEGGIGQYDGAGDLFVHADVGPKRAWFER